MTIRKYLDISTAHLPEEVMRRMQDGEAPWIYETLTYGFWVWAGDEGVEMNVPDGLAPILKYAREQGCGYVMFDCDVDPIEGFPIYDW